MSSLRTRLIFMGVLNALFAPFIVVYLLIYSFFRYFEVSPREGWHYVLTGAGVPQEPFVYWLSWIHSVRAVEVSRVQ